MGGLAPIDWNDILAICSIPLLLLFTSAFLFITTLIDKKLKKLYLGIAILHFLIFLYFFTYFIMIEFNFYPDGSPSYPCLLFGIPFFIIGIIFIIQYQAFIRKQKLDTKKINIINKDNDL